MARVSLVNILVGFLVIGCAALGGFFVANESARGFVIDPQILQSWQYAILSSAHGHSNLFGMLHILLGLTQPYSCLSDRSKVIQSIGLAGGTITMSVLMLLHAFGTPRVVTNDWLAMVMGILLTLATAALFSHCYGIAYKLKR